MIGWHTYSKIYLVYLTLIVSFALNRKACNITDKFKRAPQSLSDKVSYESE